MDFNDLVLQMFERRFKDAGGTEEDLRACKGQRMDDFVALCHGTAKAVPCGPDIDFDETLVDPSGAESDDPVIRRRASRRG